MENISLVLEGDGTCGLRLEGDGNQTIVVSKLHRRGRAHRAGLKIGDEVVSVCGISCRNLDAQAAQDIVRNTNNARIQIRRNQQDIYHAPPSAYDDFDSDVAEGYNPSQPPPPPPHRTVYDFNKNVNVYETNTQPFRNYNTSSKKEDVTCYNEYWNRCPANDNYLNNDRNQNSKYRKVEFGLNYGPPNTVKQQQIKKHITRAYIVPEYEKIQARELHNVSTHARHYVKKDEDKFEERFHKPATEVEDTPAPIIWKPKLQSITEHHKPVNMREDVIIWSSKPLPEPIRPPPVFKKSSPPPIKIIPPPPQPPPVVETPIPPTPPTATKTDEPSPGVVVNEDLIEAGLLTRGVVTAAGVPVEVHLEKKKLFSDSSFYEDPAHKYPTIEEQIKMARKVANLLTSQTGKSGKGQKMFQKKKEQSTNWIIDLDPLAKESIERERMKKKMMERTFDTMAFHDGTGPFDQKSRVDRAKELEMMRLKEEKSLHNVVPFDLCAKLANELKQDKGKGGHLFTKRKEESVNWVASENDPQSTVGYKPYKHELNPFKKPLSFTPLKSTQLPSPTKPSHFTLKLPQQGVHAPTSASDSVGELPRNRLKDMINTPRAAMTPWDSMVNTGSLHKAFEHLNGRFYIDGSDITTGSWFNNRDNDGEDMNVGGVGSSLEVSGSGGGSGGFNSPSQSKSFMPPHQPRSFNNQSQSSYTKYQPIKFQPRFM
ncbi:hypothetical protein HELRODRAFT_166598 [Helobdella robusta]|uniref:PDZ domain-containing protein n=1 Tax=Helobdella robusta TaxID=6412 RepID=T1EYA3_HELRO|nr:hypothetical protein HELRODRAFT_166598 [Helobdella robusta]ESO11588.1 hypothetical protein HELRODRAFT_166598 [Helobdella robusta]